MPPKKTSTPELQISQNLPFQQKFWQIERAGWGVMLLLILAGLAGLFGGLGPLASAQVQQGEFQVEYDRFTRQLAPASMTFLLAPNEATDSASFWIEQNMLDHFQIRSIAPTPDEVRTENERIHYTFTGSPQEVTIQWQAERVGWVNAQVGHQDTTLTLQQLIYP